MEITVTKSGGVLAPATDETWGPVDTVQAGDGGERLKGLVESVGFFELPSNYPTKGPDQFEYTIEVTDGGKSYSVSYSDDSDGVPSELKEIAGLMEQQSGN